MTKTLFLASIAVATLLGACGKKDKTVYKTPATETVSQTEDPIYVPMMEIGIDKAYKWPGQTDPFEIVNSRISGDSLLIRVQYSGGCKDHGFKMTSNLMWLKSKPPQLNIYLEHENNEDNCRALINQTIAFDLKKVRNPSSEVVKLIMNDNRESVLTYAY